MNQEDLVTEPGLVLHPASERGMTFGEIAASVDSMEPSPAVPEDALKDPDDFRLIGHSLPRRDTPAKVRGTAQFAIDVVLPDMVYGVISRAPAAGSHSFILPPASPVTTS
ncbi:MAG: hypothetical protein P8Y40_11835 [Desulfobacterales bacterium]